ncbi:MAG: hypothetical protein JWR62_2680 [Modestobacter sp.]|jgi:hypothetical protein|nr:hypothetical protein [Modestobacter sp.]
MAGLLRRLGGSGPVHDGDRTAVADEPAVSSGRRPEAAGPGATDALTYLAVINGTDLWIAAQVSHPRSGRLVLVHRQRKEIRLLPEPVPADLAGQDLPVGTVLAACPVTDVVTDRDAGIWDVALLTDDPSPRLLPLAAHALIHPAPPTAPAPHPNGTTLVPYRTRDGRGAIRVRVAEATAEVVRIASGPGRLVVTIEFRSWVGPSPTTMVMAERRGLRRVEIPLDVRAERAEAAVPLDLLVPGGTGGSAGVWDVVVEGPAGRTPCGRTARDVAAPRRVYRYATHDASPAVDGAPTSFRPYFTNDRHLAVEVTGTGEPGNGA